MKSPVRVAIVAAALALAFPAAGHAQNSKASPAGTAKAAGSSSSIDKRDRDFMMKAAQAGHAEVATGNVASTQAASEAVKQFGAQMVKDHTTANDELKSIAQGKGVSLPDAPDNAHQKALEKLKGMSGASFDRQYIADAGVKDHTAAQKLFSDEAKNGKDADVKAFAQKTLPVITHHLEMARDLAKKK